MKKCLRDKCEDFADGEGNYCAAHKLVAPFILKAEPDTDRPSRTRSSSREGDAPFPRKEHPQLKLGFHEQVIAELNLFRNDLSFCVHFKLPFGGPGRHTKLNVSQVDLDHIEVAIQAAGTANYIAVFEHLGFLIRFYDPFDIFRKTKLVRAIWAHLKRVTSGPRTNAQAEEILRNLWDKS